MEQSTQQTPYLRKMSDKKLTILDRFLFTVNYIKNFLFIITPLTALFVYIGTLVAKDTNWYKDEKAMYDWYIKKQQTHAVGLRVDNDGDLYYKAEDGKIYRAYYKEDLSAYFYTNRKGIMLECH